MAILLFESALKRKHNLALKTTFFLALLRECEHQITIKTDGKKQPVAESRDKWKQHT